MSENQQIDFDGSDDDIRARFDQYLISLLSSAKAAEDPTPEQRGKHLSCFCNRLTALFGKNISLSLPSFAGKDFYSDYNLSWVRCWQGTNNYRIWNGRTDAGIGHIARYGSRHMSESAWGAYKPTHLSHAAQHTHAKAPPHLPLSRTPFSGGLLIWGER